MTRATQQPTKPCVLSPRSIAFGAMVALLATVAPMDLAFTQASQLIQPASEPKAAMRDKASAARMEIERMKGGSYVDAALRRAETAAKEMSADGEPVLAAEFTLEAANLAASINDWQRVAVDYFPRRAEIAAALDSKDPKLGDDFLAIMIQLKSAEGDRAGRQAEADALLQRARTRDGAGSESDLRAQYLIAFAWMQSDGQEGFDKLNAMLAQADKTSFDAFTLDRYADAGRQFRQSGFPDIADEILNRGLISPAAKRTPLETGQISLQLAMTKEATGDKKSAFQLYLQATNTLHDRYGGESLEQLYAADKFAVFTSRLGSPASSANRASGIYEIARRVLGEDHPETWKFANNYADMLREIGASAQAIPLDEFVLAKRIKAYGPNHLNVLVSANNMGQTYLNLGRYDEARKSFQQTMEIADALHDESNVKQGAGWLLATNLIGGLVKMDATHAGAMEAVAADEQYSDILRFKAAKLAAGWFAQKNETTKAISILNDATKLAQQNFSVVHPLTFDLRLAIAETKAREKPSEATEDYAKLDMDMQDWMARDIGGAGNRLMAEASRALSDDFLFSYAAFALANPRAQPAFADAAFRWASVENGKRDPLRRIARSLPPEDTETRQMIRYGLHLSYLAQELLSSGSWNEYTQSVLDKITATDALLNHRLNNMPDFDRAVLDTPMQPPEKLLGKDEAMVSYFITRKWKPDRQAANPYEETILYALVARGGEPSKLISLGDTGRIGSIGAEYQIASLRGAPSGPERGAVAMASIDRGFSDLHGQLVAPLLDAIGDAKTLFVVPDGQLYSVPFSLLRDAKGRLIEQRFTLRLLTRPDALYGIGAEQSMATNAKAVLVGGLDYANGNERGAEPLPGALREVQDIAALLRDAGGSVDIITGDRASEAAVRKNIEAGAAIAHLATHGSYESERLGGAAGVDTLWQSGIILSRSGDRRTMKRDGEDGRLYAFEMMDWDLTRLELLVLSACETGRGDESFVSGLRGLPTAVSIAGAKRSLLALRPVDDAGTEEFMVRFYEHLIAGKSYPEALRQTRLDAIAGELPAAKDPLVWAAFVMFEN